MTLVVSFSAMQAQDASDAYRYAQDNATGTARFRAMGGAFGAVGGDLSAININPAGSVIFANNQISVTASNFNTKNNSNYFGKQTSDSNNSLDLNQAGGIFVFENSHEDNNWKKFSIGINYENINNFDNSLFSAGTNNNSIDNYFLNNANGLKLSIVNGTDYDYSELSYQEQQAYLGYAAYVINESPTYNDATNRSYVSLVAPGGNYFQTNSIKTTGYNSKVTFNAATQYKDILMLGINLNTYFTDYRRSSRFTESNSNNTSAVDDYVNRINFNNNLYTYGSGFSMQLGAILKPMKDVRLGLSYQSPTWYKLNDELTQSISAVSGNTTGNLPEDVVDPMLTVIYPAYKLQTPSKITGSLVYIFGKRGLISFDYSMKNYGNLAFKPKDDAYFQSVNSSIATNSKGTTAEYSIGGEYKIQQFSLRGGYHFEESPYKNKTTIGDLTSYSGGIGYNFGSSKLDLAYTTAKRNSDQQFFSQGLTDAARINTKNNNITLTFAFEL